MTCQPEAYSTPKILNLRGRRGIGEQEDSIQSPIVGPPLNDDSIEGSQSEEEIDECFTSEEESNFYPRSYHSRHRLEPHESACRPDQSIFGFGKSAVVAISILVLALVSFIVTNSTNHETSSVKLNITIETLSLQFPSQETDFWLNIAVAVNEINRVHVPKSIILFYQDDGMETLEQMLKEISNYAVCQITSCTSKPVDINGVGLGKKEILENYGTVITNNKDNLEKSGVMIIRNLDEVPGKSAQAFHSLCDEYNPVVKKALFLFTVKMKGVQDKNTSSIEKYLRLMWSDLDDDRFYPLFARISSTVLPVMKETSLLLK